MEKDWTRNPYKLFRKHEHLVGPGEKSYVWDPFSNGKSEMGEYIMVCQSNGSMGKKPMGVDFWTFDGRSKNVIMPDGSVMNVRKDEIRSFR